jgi:Zn-dependent protease with chaperone function
MAIHTTSSNPLNTLHEKLSRQYSKSLFDEVASASIEDLRPKSTTSSLLAVALSTLVHGWSVIIFAAGFFLIFSITKSFNPFLLLIGIAAVATGWQMRPRLDRIPKEKANLQDFPMLYSVVHKIAEVLGSPQVSTIVLTPEFNASFQRVGVGQKIVLRLGVPLLSVLDKDEFIALVGHELAHGINGDPNRGLYIGSAVRSLAYWSYLLHPRVLYEDGSGLVGLLGIPFKLLALLLSNLSRFTAFILVNLLWRSSQRSEYLADYLASKASGTSSMIRMLHKLYYGHLFTETVHQYVIGKPKWNFFDEFISRVTNLSGERLQAIKEKERSPESQVDTTHPPTVNRIELLEKHFVKVPTVTISNDEYSKLCQEVANTHKTTLDEIVDAYRSGLYY